MRQNKWVTLLRDCDALLIPTAEPVTIPSGTNVHIVQELGGNYTVSVNGNLVRIDGSQADALGMEIANAPASGFETLSPATQAANESDIWQALRTCFDPEIPVNIVDLGLIYEVTIDWQPTEKRNIIHIVMTLTAPGCGMGPVLTEDVTQKVLQVDNVTNVNVELVFDPPWDRAMMSEPAQLELGLL